MIAVGFTELAFCRCYSPSCACTSGTPRAGFKAWRASTLRAIHVETIRSNGYSFQVEMNLAGAGGPGQWKEPGPAGGRARLCFGPAQAERAAQTAYSSSGWARLGCRSLDSDCFSSCLIRSRVRPRALPISSRVCGLPS